MSKLILIKEEIALLLMNDGVLLKIESSMPTLIEYYINLEKKFIWQVGYAVLMDHFPKHLNDQSMSASEMPNDKKS